MNDASSVKKIDLKKTDWRGSREFFESLADELRSLDDKDEKYDFTWVGKRKAIIEAGAPINKTLRPDVKNSKNWDTTENLFIEGDNLDALKLLQESYLGKVKMIYIDPPYNTGKDFVYHDNFKANIEEYDEATEYKDEEGNIQFKKNEKSNGRYHSDWLSMMYPRLKLARNLLSDDGVIFISIDDNEQANLKRLCDEIFGEDNFLNAIIWRYTSGGIPESGKFSSKHDTILFYAKQAGNHKFNMLTEKSYSQTIPEPNTESGMVLGVKRDEKCEYCGGSPGGKYRDAVMRDVWLDINSLFRNHWEKKLLETMGTPFDTQKPTKLIERMLLSGSDKNSLILDCFAGSGTTAHAVMQLNAEDGGNRKWIMVQLPEETPEDSEARKAGYKTIPEIARERIRRAGDKIDKEHPDAKVDYGFRSLVIADTNYKEVYKPVSEISQESLIDTVDNIKEDRGDLDLLYGVLTQLALELNRSIETRDISGSTVYLYDYLGEVSGLVACFSPSVSDEAIKHIARLKPLTAVFRDSSFADSQAKVNLAEHFRVISPDTKVRVI